MMKIFALIFLNYYSIFTFSQQINNKSIEVIVAPIFYFYPKSNAEIHYEKNCNYNLGLFYNHKNNKIFNLKYGVFLYTKNYFEHYKNSFLLIKAKQFKLTYINIDMLANINYPINGKFVLSGAFGIAYGHLIDKDKKIIYLNGSSEAGTWNNFFLKSPWFLQNSIGINYLASNAFSFFLQPYFKFQFIPDWTNNPRFESINVSGTAYGILLGVEYNF